MAPVEPSNFCPRASPKSQQRGRKQTTNKASDQTNKVDCEQTKMIALRDLASRCLFGRDTI
jgi:hypothetical protein